MTRALSGREIVVENIAAQVWEEFRNAGVVWNPFSWAESTEGEKQAIVYKTRVFSNCAFTQTLVTTRAFSRVFNHSSTYRAFQFSLIRTEGSQTGPAEKAAEPVYESYIELKFYLSHPWEKVNLDRALLAENLRELDKFHEENRGINTADGLLKRELIKRAQLLSPLSPSKLEKRKSSLGLFSPGRASEKSATHSPCSVSSAITGSPQSNDSGLTPEIRNTKVVLLSCNPEVQQSKLPALPQRKALFHKNSDVVGVEPVEKQSAPPVKRSFLHRASDPVMPCQRQLMSQQLIEKQQAEKLERKSPTRDIPPIKERVKHPILRRSSEPVMPCHRLLHQLNPKKRTLAPIEETGKNQMNPPGH